MRPVHSASNSMNQLNTHDKQAGWREILSTRLLLPAQCVTRHRAVTWVCHTRPVWLAAARCLSRGWAWPWHSSQSGFPRGFPGFQPGPASPCCRAVSGPAFRNFMTYYTARAYGTSLKKAGHFLRFLRLLLLGGNCLFLCVYVCVCASCLFVSRFVTRWSMGTNVCMMSLF